MHQAIVGITGSGKSTLGKLLNRQLVERKQHCAILDPFLDPQWKGEFITDDPQRFNLYMRKNINVYGFIDESGDMLDRHVDDMWWLCTSGRHYGHQLTLLAQRTMQIPMMMRENVERFYVFSTGGKSGKILAEELNQQELTLSPRLERFCFMQASRFADPRYGELTTPETVKYHRKLSGILRSKGSDATLFDGEK